LSFNLNYIINKNSEGNFPHVCGFRDFLGAFAKLRRATISFVTSVHLCVSTHGTTDSHWTNFHEIWHLSYSLTPWSIVLDKHFTVLEGS